MYSPKALRSIIRTSIGLIDLWSPVAEQLMLGTAAHESHLGKHLHQISGPALGVFQMEPDTLDDLYNNYLNYQGRLDLKTLVGESTGTTGPDQYQLTFNPVYSAIMCRLHYKRILEPFPHANDIPALGIYWDTHYNRNPTKGFPAQFVADYQRLVANPTPF